MKHSLIGVAVLGLFVGVPVAYGADGFYVGVGGGVSLFEDACQGSTGSCDDSGRATTVYGGRQFGPDTGPNMGLELAYVSLGSMTATDPTLGNLEVKAKGYSLTGIGTAPVAGPLSLIGRVGLFLSSLQARVSGSSSSESARNSTVTVGLGVRWTFSDQFYARLEWELFSDLGDDETGILDVDMFSAGVGFSF